MQNDVILSPVQIFFRNKWVRLFLIIDVIAVLVIIGILIWQTTKVSTINFDVTPIDSTISINGNSDYSNGEFSVTPGTYEITISHEGLKTKTFTIDVSPEHVVSISTFLSDEKNSFDFYKLRDNYMSYKKLEEIASSRNNITIDHDTSAESFIQKFQKNYNNFSTKLPIEYHKSEGYGAYLQILENITIKANYNCNLTLCVQALIVGTENKDLIKSLMEEKGLNAEDFEIEYKFY